jgi:hypothetical protein
MIFCIHVLFSTVQPLLEKPEGWDKQPAEVHGDGYRKGAQPVRSSVLSLSDSSLASLPLLSLGLPISRVALIIQLRMSAFLQSSSLTVARVLHICVCLLSVCPQHERLATIFRAFVPLAAAFFPVNECRFNVQFDVLR